MIEALRRASAHRITAVVPFFGYARADKKVLPREPISARLMCDLFLAAGADRIVSIDLHTGQIQGFFPKPLDHLTALPIVTEYLKDRLDGPTTIVSPDAGGVKRAEKYARYLGAFVAFVHKRRSADVPNRSKALTVVGAVRGRHAVIVDDMIDTGGTVVNAARLLRQKQVRSVLVAATHPILSEPALDRLKNAPDRRGGGDRHPPHQPGCEELRQVDQALDRSGAGRGAASHLHGQLGLGHLPRRKHLTPWIRRSFVSVQGERRPPSTSPTGWRRSCRAGATVWCRCSFRIAPRAWQSSRRGPVPTAT